MPDSSHEEHQIEVAGLPIQLRRGGSGSALLMVHHETGNPGWLPFHDSLAQSHDVLLPTLPGWDGTQRGDWMRNPRDIASVLQLLLDELAVERCAVVGLGFGGFLAAEMAVANQARIDGLVLVGAMGLQIEGSEIRDQFLEGHEDYTKSCFHDVANFHALFGETPSTEQLIAWDANREMTARTAWKPFLYSQSLPHLLPSVRVPALVVHAEHDTVVPQGCAEAYAQLLGNAQLETLADAGHIAEAEQAEALAGMITGFLG